MKAAVVTAFGEPPRLSDVAEPHPSGPNEIVVRVLAAGLHPRVRSGASGSHYTSTGVLPLIPGVDGVGRTESGSLVYFVVDGDGAGSMAERVVVERAKCVELPQDCDPVRLAAGMNPAMSSWVALRHRAPFQSGQSVLVLGATGSSGRLAVQVARLFGASDVVGVGRNAAALAELPQLGATATVHLTHDLDQTAQEVARSAAEVDVVLDYIWGAVSGVVMARLISARRERSRHLSWVEIGSTAGTDASIPSAALRAANLAIVGSGQGSVDTRRMLAELPEIARAISTGQLDIEAEPVALQDLTDAWRLDRPGDGRRIVIVPGG